MSSEQPRKPPPQIPSDMKAFNQKIIEEFRANKGELSGQMAGRKLMLLTTTGSESGQPRTAVLGFAKDSNRYVIVASANAAPENPSWYGNLVTNPQVTVEVGAEKFSARARTADPKERERVKGLLPFFEGQQQKTTRELPLVILEREQG
ncbi:MAG: nitroreductase/quinone reductase family protein [Candidatus Dormibacter sp.]